MAGLAAGSKGKITRLAVPEAEARRARRFEGHRCLSWRSSTRIAPVQLVSGCWWTRTGGHPAHVPPSVATTPPLQPPPRLRRLLSLSLRFSPPSVSSFHRRTDDQFPPVALPRPRGPSTSAPPSATPPFNFHQRLHRPPHLASLPTPRVIVPSPAVLAFSLVSTACYPYLLTYQASPFPGCCWLDAPRGDLESLPLNLPRTSVLLSISPFPRYRR